LDTVPTETVICHLSFGIWNLEFGIWNLEFVIQHLSKELFPMKRLDAYSQPPAPWTRIEMLLAAFDGITSRLERAQALLDRKETLAAQPLLVRSQQIVLALYEGIDLRHGQIPENMQKLYLFILSCIGMGPALDVPAALRILGRIREGLDAIRESAAGMERRGELSPVVEDPRLLRHIVA
jgi:flagellin-specific chaperone FliS